jgi:hypothetical protein
MRSATLPIARLLAALVAFATPLTQPARSAVPQPGGPAVGKIVKVTGSASIRRPGLNKSVAAGRNVQVFAGDRLVVDQGASVKIVCFAGMSQPQFVPGDNPVECPQPAPGADTFTDIMNGGRQKVSTIRGPNGRVLTPKANEYTQFLVKIINSRPVGWSTSITLDKPLGNEQRQRLVNNIRGMAGIEPDEKRLLLAEVYAMNKRYDLAVDQLKTVTGSQSDPFVQLFLGDLYLALNLGLDAKRSYAAAVAASVAANDRLGEAYAQHALGLMLLYEGARAEDAKSALDRAVLLYTELGETRAAEMVQAELTPTPVPTTTPTPAPTTTPTQVTPKPEATPPTTGTPTPTPPFQHAGSRGDRHRSR